MVVSQAAEKLHLQPLNLMPVLDVAFRSTIAQQSNYEKSVFSKTSRTNARGEGTNLQFWYAVDPWNSSDGPPVLQLKSQCLMRWLSATSS